MKSVGLEKNMLIEEIKTDLWKARVARDEGWASCIRTLLGDLQKSEKDGQELTDAYVVKVVKKYIKNANDCMSILPEGDLRRGSYSREIHLLEYYIPKQLTEEDIVSILNREFLDIGERVDIGSAMKFLKQGFGNQVDGKVAAKAIKGMM